MNKIAITLGDTNGIGAEIIIKALNKMNLSSDNVIIIGNSDIFNFYSKKLNLKLKQKYEILEIPFDIKHIEIGKNSKYSGEFSYNCLVKACELAKNGKINSIVTAPVSKNALNMAGYNFSGQTEILEKFLGDKEHHAEMFFVAKDFRVLLLTRHIPLNKVSENITKKMIIEKINRLNNELKNKFNIKMPKIGFCALNPHAGENGLIGKEEQEIILPAIDELNKQNIKISKPYPADSLLKTACQKYLKNEPQPYDTYIACYHDQGLIPIKSVAFDYTVNTTIGLPVLRTSPAHGTAFDIAGKNLADELSMVEAIKLAL